MVVRARAYNIYIFVAQAVQNAVGGGHVKAERH